MGERLRPLRIALAQINPTVGDVDGNAHKIGDYLGRAAEREAAIVVFPELALSGYPPEDLLLQRRFLDAVAHALAELAQAARDTVAVVGFPERSDDVYDSAAVLAAGKVVTVHRKRLLASYRPFDEGRYFRRGREAGCVDLGGVPAALAIGGEVLEDGPVTPPGTQLILNPAAQPYRAGASAAREEALRQRARESVALVARCELVGAQDELVFEGRSLMVGPDGAVLARAPQFEEELVVGTLDPEEVMAARLLDARGHAGLGAAGDRTIPSVAVKGGVGSAGEEPVSAGEEAVGESCAQPMEPHQELYAALTTGLGDYARKNGFDHAVLALSGGIDSALTACVAVDALGAERVTCLALPSPFSSEGTRRDARAIAKNLGTDLVEIDIEPAMEVYDELLAEVFAGTEKGAAEENIQARIRGNLVMALSNRFGWLPLATGNKSEGAVGYATLYGDMAGAFAPLKDVYKRQVYRLVRWRNSQAKSALVPASVSERPPSAELSLDQSDEEDLLPYESLDRILEGYLEHGLDADDLARRGLRREDAARVISMVDAAEYKRRQAAPGVLVSVAPSPRGQRLPMTTGFRG